MNENKAYTDHFENFYDYWKLTRDLDQFQKDILFSAMTKDQRLKIMKSFEDGGWEDLFMRNKLDKLVDEIKDEVDQDLIAIRCKIMMGRCHYMKKSQWIYIKDRVNECASKHKHLEYLLGNIKVEPEGESSVCLTSTKKGVHV